jgi:hypothetical protein
MANYRLKANGNVATLATWQDDSSGAYADSTVLPTINDNVFANNFIGTITADFSVRTMSTASATNVTRGGYFTVTADCTVIATNGYITQNAEVSPLGVAKSCIVVSAICNCTIIGEHNGTHGSTSVITIDANATVDIIGNGYSQGTGGVAVWNTVNANLSKVSITGNHRGSDINTAASYCIYNQGENATIKHTGIRTGGLVSVSTHAFYNVGASAIIELKGSDVTRATSINASRLSGFNTFLLDTVIDGYDNAVNIDANNKTFTLKGSIRGNLARAIVHGTNTTVILNGAALYYFNGVPPILPALWKMIDNINNKFCFEHPTTNAEVCIYSELNQPIEADVREGVDYVSRTGTLAVPPPSLVVRDVPTDNTVGTWEFGNTLIERLERVATTEEVGTIWAD